MNIPSMSDALKFPPSERGLCMTEWYRILEPGEQLLWTGRPDYGRRFFQIVGHERYWHLGHALGIVALWGVLPFLKEDKVQDAVWFFGMVTLILLLSSVVTARFRADILGSLFYAVTDRRAVVVRKGRNVFSRMRSYVVSCPHRATYPYAITKGRPYDTLRVGSMLSEDVVQPFGFGLYHEGWNPLKLRGISPISFENIHDATGVHEAILTLAKAANGRRST